MNNNNSHFNRSNENDDSLDLRQQFYKYFFFWKYFLASVLICLSIAFLFNRYSPKIYDSNAKIQVLDKKQNNLEMPTAEDLFSSSKINLENEIEILKSSSILEEVIQNLKLNISIEAVGEIMSFKTLDFPFDIKAKISLDSVSNLSFNLLIEKENLVIEDLINDKNYLFKNLTTKGVKHNLPFEIYNIKKDDWIHQSYNLNFLSTIDVINSFKKDVVISKVGRNSDIINLNFRNTNSEYARIVLNEIIEVFNNDGIRDRQLIHKRTIDFVNERYLYLQSELEDIELEKELYKVENNLTDIKFNSNISLQKNSIFEDNLFSNENQTFIVNNLLEELSKLDYELLPSNIGVQNLEINEFIQSYNQSILDQRKLIISAGPNNPYVKQLNNSISDIRLSIISSLKNYLKQLNILKVNLLSQFSSVQNNVANIPGQEKYLRSIDRNQQIKEALYLFLLQKGEEAQVSYAVTEPSIKVVEYAISEKNPLSPKTNIIFLVAIFVGLLIPFTILYLFFLNDTKIHSREDIEKSGLSIIGEIPFFDLTEKEKVFLNPDDRSIISESFRMLMSNVRYLQKKDSKSNVILITSSIKGEGKTLNALNLALTFSSVSKKILLIGSDLRNPQIHKYIDYDKNVAGLVDFLVDNKSNWKKNIINPFENQQLDILLSGPIPPNALNLLNNGNIDILIKEARAIYDYIIIDSAPTLLVADTKSIIDKSDILIYLTRCNITDKNILDHISDVANDTDANVGIILNGVGQQNSYGYSYGYGYKYGYGYNYKYSYNYGYGYGYNEES
ncbi:MAG: hypothetical protein CMJ05_00180 [Pelagibacterales bacterium]|nr:hypothetical protein [Pelagibacterales bacterium]